MTEDTGNLGPNFVMEGNPSVFQTPSYLSSESLLYVISDTIDDDDQNSAEVREDIKIEESDDTDNDFAVIQEEIYVSKERAENRVSRPGEALLNDPLSENLLKNDEEKAVVSQKKVKSKFKPAKKQSKQKKRSKNSVKSIKKTKSGKPTTTTVDTEEPIVASSVNSELETKEETHLFKLRNSTTITVGSIQKLIEERNKIPHGRKQRGISRSTSLSDQMVLKAQDCEFPFSQKISLDIIQMDVRDENLEHLLIYKDLFTSYTLLRPLAYKFNVMELSLELFKIFADFGIPKIVEVGTFYISDVNEAIKNLQRSFHTSQIIVKYHSPQNRENVSKEGNDVKNRLMKWIEVEKNTNWAIGCYIIQQHLNKKITTSDRFSPYAKVFAKDSIMAKHQKDPSNNNCNKPCPINNKLDDVAKLDDTPSDLVEDQTEISKQTTNNKLQQSSITNNSIEQVTKCYKQITDSSGDNCRRPRPLLFSDERRKTKVDKVKKPVQKTNVKLQKRNTVIDPPTESNSSVKKDAISVYKHLLLEQLDDTTFQSSSSDSDWEKLALRRKRKVRKTKNTQPQKNTQSEQSIMKQTVLSFESFSGLDMLLNVPSPSVQVTDEVKLEKCEKCDRDMTKGMKCLECSTENNTKDTTELTHLTPSIDKLLKRFL